ASALAARPAGAVEVAVDLLGDGLEGSRIVGVADRDEDAVVTERLHPLVDPDAGIAEAAVGGDLRRLRVDGGVVRLAAGVKDLWPQLARRSEERRVGKECR